MLVIRLKPVGKKHQISFRVVVAEKRSKLDGKYREDLGFYNPATNKFNINKERANYWLSVGAQPSDTVYNIFITAKIVEGPKRPVKMKKPEPIQEEKPELIQEEKKETENADTSKNDQSVSAEENISANSAAN